VVQQPEDHLCPNTAPGNADAQKTLRVNRSSACTGRARAADATPFDQAQSCKDRKCRQSQAPTISDVHRGIQEDASVRADSHTA
jgi:hypothetical protein